MNEPLNNDTNSSGSTRRHFLGAGLALTATTLMAGCATSATSGLTREKAAQGGDGGAGSVPEGSAAPIGRRKLGSLEVSAIGMGVQNMHRKYTTEVPTGRK